MNGRGLSRMRRGMAGAWHVRTLPGACQVMRYLGIPGALCQPRGWYIRRLIRAGLAGERVALSNWIDVERTADGYWRFSSAGWREVD